tara:strand:- start:664 stop:966 length:303 start_codon:yes stop_codon:yes gene_type:complete
MTTDQHTKGVTLFNTTRTTYKSFFAEQIMSAFYSPNISSASAMDCADKFRHEEWRLDDDAPYAENTRNDLIKLGADDLRLSVFIIDVINCMRYNRSIEMD